jgi:hypothetical protein
LKVQVTAALKAAAKAILDWQPARLVMSIHLDEGIVTLSQQGHRWPLPVELVGRGTKEGERS